MTHLGGLKPDLLVKVINWTGWPLIIAYCLSMFIWPLWNEGLQWNQVQNVWERWQALNVGMLAFTSSLIAFTITERRAQERQVAADKAEAIRKDEARARHDAEVRAAYAYLPATLSDLTDYFLACSSVMKDSWERNFHDEAPEAPDAYRQVLSECIKYSDPEVANFLAYLIRNMQVLSSRVAGMCSREHQMTDQPNLIANFFKLGELQARIDRLFPYARGEHDLNLSPLAYAELENSYGILRIDEERYFIPGSTNLVEFSRRRLEAN